MDCPKCGAEGSISVEATVPVTVYLGEDGTPSVFNVMSSGLEFVDAGGAQATCDECDYASLVDMAEWENTRAVRRGQWEVLD